MHVGKWGRKNRGSKGKGREKGREEKNMKKWDGRDGGRTESVSKERGILTEGENHYGTIENLELYFLFL